MLQSIVRWCTQTVLYYVDPLGVDKTRLTRADRDHKHRDVQHSNSVAPADCNGTAEHCFICIPGRACVERFVTCVWPNQG